MNIVTVSNGYRDIMEISDLKNNCFSLIRNPLNLPFNQLNTENKRIGNLNIMYDFIVSFSRYNKKLRLPS